MVLDIQGPAGVGECRLLGPRRLIVALPGIHLDPTRLHNGSKASPFGYVELLEFEGIPVLTLDLKEPASEVEAFLLTRPDRVVIDLFFLAGKEEGAGRDASVRPEEEKEAEAADGQGSLRTAGLDLPFQESVTSTLLLLACLMSAAALALVLLTVRKGRSSAGTVGAGPEYREKIEELDRAIRQQLMQFDRLAEEDRDGKF